jgi:hypothetical protein
MIVYFAGPITITPDDEKAIFNLVLIFGTALLLACIVSILWCIFAIRRVSLHKQSPSLLKINCILSVILIAYLAWLKFGL